MPTIQNEYKNSIFIKGAKVHNLKNVNIAIPRNKLVVVTGLSGSGKSSLAFDTLYAEGQRRYIESLSSYARQFLGKINKPDVDSIEGIPPAIAIEQKVNTRNPRSTVGTSTEVYDYLKLLFARIGKTFSPVSGLEIKRHHVTDIVNYILGYDEGTKIILSAPIAPKEDRDLTETLEMLILQGFTRIESCGELIKIEDTIDGDIFVNPDKDINLIIDRLTVSDNKDTISRISDSVQTALFEGKGYCIVGIYNGSKLINKTFSNLFEADGIEFPEPSVHLFSFNNPLGACPKCEGFGQTIGIDEDLVFPEKSFSIYDGAIACWKGEKMGKWKDKLVMNADKFDFPIHKPYYKLSDEQKELLWSGNKHFEGLTAFFKMLDRENYKIQYRVMIARYRGKTKCDECKGSRLKKEACYVKVNNYTISDLVLMPINKLLHFFENIELNEYEKDVSKRLLVEIQSRLRFLENVGLGYLTLNRKSSTLSGGESQRINLATSLGSSLVGSLYILDEPSIGLHSRDTHLLIKVLRELQKIGNTVLVVEHDEEIIKAADEIIDLGPLAGRLGGELVFQGNIAELLDSSVPNGKHESLTRLYLNGTKQIPIPESRRKWNNFIEITGASENNLKNIDVKIPLNIMTVITGVSGSGKTSLIKTIFYPALKRHFGGYGLKAGRHASVSGDFQLIFDIEFIDQNPIGKSSRSNPVTYLKAYDEIRKLYSNQPYAKSNGYKASHFSFNIDGGRCEECQGEGVIKVEMQFMADVHLVCENCEGKRFKQDVLDVEYKGKSIFDILEMTVNESIEFFKEGNGSAEKKVIKKLMPLLNVGLGYVKLGQSSSTLSGGESQRIKLASFLSKEKTQASVFVFDEPTTGLHFHDIEKLLEAFNALIRRGHTIVIIEHNPEIIKSADWLIDLGPEGGENGGTIVFEGTPEDIIKCKSSYTGAFLKEKISAK